MLEGIRVTFENIRSIWDTIRAKNRFLSNPGDIEAQLDFIEYAPLTDRYMPGWKKIWKEWAVEFEKIYFFAHEDDRRAIGASIQKRKFSPSQHVVMAELLWENCEGSNRASWISELLREWHAGHEQDAHEIQDFEIYLRISDVIPRTVKEDVLKSTLAEGRVDLPIVVTAVSSV